MGSVCRESINKTYRVKDISTITSAIAYTPEEPSAGPTYVLAQKRIGHAFVHETQSKR